MRRMVVEHVVGACDVLLFGLVFAWLEVAQFRFLCSTRPHPSVRSQEITQRAVDAFV